MQRRQQPLLAALLTVFASAFIAGTTLLAKAIGTGALGTALHPLQVSNGRFIFAFTVIGIAGGALRAKIKHPNWITHIKRSTLGWSGVTLMFAASAYIPLSDATAISFLNPVFGMIFAFFLLREHVGIIRWSAALAALIGAIILLRPTPASFDPYALFALGAAILLGLELIFIKRLSGQEGPFQILIINNLVGVIISSIACAFVWTAPTLQQWMALAGIGVLMALAQTCFVNAMARADASFVSAFVYTTLVFTTLYDFALFDVVPDVISMFGASIIIAGVALLAWRGNRIKPSNDTPS